MERIKIGIFGMGNLGRAVEDIINSRSDEFELIQTFDRENGDTIKKFVDKIDVLLVCVGSSHDAPIIVPKLAKLFNTVDTFDTHTNLEPYIDSVRKSHGKNPNKVAIVGTGWDPGLLSIIRLYMTSFMPTATLACFYGKGVSLGHTNAIKNISGVLDAVQFTIPIKSSINFAKKGDIPKDKHTRLCYVVAHKQDRVRIKHEIITMPNYFKPYKTKVKFVSQKTFDVNFKTRQEHQGLVISKDNNATAEFTVYMEKNPYFTAQIQLAYAIAAHNLLKDGKHGIFTVADIAPKYLFTRNIIDMI
ncbi:MAG: diaminopimelate dehydrogenase [Firmicutes bacterium]|nr:diaminopimelate dehydrogenase [Bacillota bacterium]